MTCKNRNDFCKRSYIWVGIYKGFYGNFKTDDRSSALDCAVPAKRIRRTPARIGDRGARSWARCRHPF